jgi:hypothetical protein
MKQCAACCKQKPLEQFGTNPRSNDKKNSYCKTCASEKERLRKQAIKAGTWVPHAKTPRPAKPATKREIAWAAGFLEGEGSFRLDTTPTVRADQINREPLEKLARCFGGRIYQRKSLTTAGNTVYCWSIHGDMARSLMNGVFLYMSKKKQERIIHCLS